MAREISSWLSSPAPDSEGYPGERLGLPEEGPGSIARFGRRLGALMVDWFIAVGLAGLVVPLGIMSREAYFYSGETRLLTPMIWIIIAMVSVRLFGFTPGQYAFGLRVIPVDGGTHVGVVRVLIRNLLISLVIPALFTDSDHRGLQDLATKTAVVRR